MKKSLFHFLSCLSEKYHRHFILTYYTNVHLQTFFLITILFLSTAAGPVCAQFIHTYTDTDSLRVGDVFEYTIVFDGEFDSIIFPSEESFEDELDVLSRQRYQLTSRRDSLVFILQFFGTEDLTIGRKEITYTSAGKDSTIYTVPVPLFFKTLLAEGDEEFRPIKPIFAFARNWWPIILLILFLILAAFFLYRWYLNRASEKAVVKLPLPVPFKNPLDELKHSIYNLPQVSTLNAREDYEAYYIKLGDTIRYYLKRVYHFPAMEMTTREINESLQQELAPSEIITITRKVLNEADLVKFANFHPDTELAKSALQKAKDFIETASIVNYEQIKYMKHKYELEQGIINPSSRPVTVSSQQK